MCVGPNLLQTTAKNFGVNVTYAAEKVLNLL
jgi:hypothetical protein